MKSNEKNVLFLTLSVFSDTGGIQRVCRTLSKTLKDILLPEGTFQVLSLCDQDHDADIRYVDANNFKGFGYARWRFCLNSIKHGFSANVIVLSHINLIPISYLINLVNPTAKIIVLTHGIEVWRPIQGWKLKFLKKRCLIWSVSQFTATKIQERHGLNGRQITVLQNCLDPFFEVPSSFEKPGYLINRFQIKEGTLILLGINRMTGFEHDKGYDQVLNAMPALLEEHPNLCYLLAGKIDSAENARLNARIIEKGLQHHVKLIGYINESELTDHYLLADIFILISKKEGFGLVLLEAAACGCSIICGNVDGSSEAVLHGKMAQQINPHHNRQLQLAVSLNLQKKQDYLRSTKVQKMCMEHFSFQAYHLKVKQLISPLITTL